MGIVNVIEENQNTKNKCPSIEISGNPSVEEIIVILSLFNLREVDK